MHRLSATDLTEERRPDVIRRGSLPLHVKKSDSRKFDSRSSKKESRDSRRSKSNKKKDKKIESKDKKVLTIMIPHDDNEIFPISDDEQDGSDKVSLNPECPARTFSQRVVPWLKNSTMRSTKHSRIYFRLKYRLGSTTMVIAFWMKVLVGKQCI